MNMQALIYVVEAIDLKFINNEELVAVRVIEVEAK